MNGMGLPCHLMGSGMAIPWTRVGDLGSTGATIVEDYKAGIRMALAGAFSVFCPDARVISYFPEKQAAAAIQRTRWEHGHLQLILDEVPVLLLTAVRRRDLRLLGLALDLAIPPLALVALMSGTAVLLAAAAALSGAAWWPLAIAIGNACILCAAVLLAWYSRGREAISLSSMLSVPAYMLAKVPLYLRFLTKRQKIWVKTDRN
jgi:cellulose synthase/poly-beta-1,6-N-acetylglucosamine synthase-like glycosyltransferase